MGCATQSKESAKGNALQQTVNAEQPGQPRRRECTPPLPRLQGLSTREIQGRACGGRILAACPTGGACHPGPASGGDASEREAERGAHAVARSGTPAVAGITPQVRVQRMCTDCAKEE